MKNPCLYSLFALPIDFELYTSSLVTKWTITIFFQNQDKIMMDSYSKNNKEFEFEVSS